MKIVVIGAGVMGASVAFHLAEAGASVTVLEAKRIGAGTSGTSFSWVNANTKEPRDYYDLNLSGMRAHAALAERFGVAPWFHPGGLEWVAPEGLEEQASRVERLKAWDYKAQWLTQAEVLGLEPDIDPEAIGGAPVVFYPEEGWLDAVRYADSMIRAAENLGAILLQNQPVVRVEMVGDRATGVITTDGSRFAADAVVNCTGRWADTALDARLRVPLAPTMGLLAYTPPVPTNLRHILHTPLCHVRPDGGMRLLAAHNHGAFELARGLAVTPELPEVVNLMQRTGRLLPRIAPSGLELRAEAVRIGVRALPVDDRSIVGPLPGVHGYYVAVTHSGVTLAPFLGEAVADEIARDRNRVELAPFRPARFFQTSQRQMK